MKVGKDFTTWIKDRIKKYYFIENEDYILTLTKIWERQNVIKHEYYLKIDVAKEIAIVPDSSKENDFWQVYYKPKAVNEIMNWFHENRKEIEYTIIYQKNTKNGVKGEIKEKGLKINNVCYKINEID